MANMATIIIAVIVFGIVGLDVWYIIRDKVQHRGKLGCGGCQNCSGGCSGSCAHCSQCHEN